MKNLCIADTCSLIYLSNTDVRIGNMSVYQWLWKEFDVRYSQAVMNEINRHKGQVTKKDYESHIWTGSFDHRERILFGHQLVRTIDQGICPRCYQIIRGTQSFTPDLADDRDRGERHNCCVAIEAIKDYSQVIYLTDDLRGNRDYVSQLFDTMPLGVVWSSLDFAVYLFIKHRDRISLDETLQVLRSLNAQDGSIEADKSTARLTKYHNKAKQIDRFLA